jgi:hypothetical protein
MYDTIFKKKSTNNRFMILYGEFPLFILLAILIPLIKLAIHLYDVKKNGKEYARYVEEITDKLKNDEEFIESLAKVVAKHFNIDDTWDDIQEIPLLQKYANEIDEKALKVFRENPSWKTTGQWVAANGPRLAQVFADTFIKAWKNPSTQNQMVQNVKSKLNKQTTAA